MDPLSITTGALALITTITKVSYEAGVFVKKVRDARNDLDNVARELLSLANILELLVEDTGSEDRQAKNLPEGLQKQIGGIIDGCAEVVKQVEEVMEKYEGGGMRKGIKWAMGGKNDMDKLLKSLEAHKTALDLALDMVQLTISKEIKDDTTEIKGQAVEIKADTAAIKDDTALILAEIARLQERIDASEAQTGPGRTTFMLDKYLDGLTTYAETVIDGTFSDLESLNFSSRNSSTTSLARAHVPGAPEDVDEERQLEKLGEENHDLEAMGAPPSYFEATTKRRADEAAENNESSLTSIAENIVVPVSTAAAPEPSTEPLVAQTPVEPAAVPPQPTTTVASPVAAAPIAPSTTTASSNVEKPPVTNIEMDLQAALRAMSAQSNYNAKGFHPADAKLPSSALMASFDSLLSGVPKTKETPLALPIQAPAETRVYLAQDSGPMNHIPAPSELAKPQGDAFIPDFFSKSADASTQPQPGPEPSVFSEPPEVALSVSAGKQPMTVVESVKPAAPTIPQKPVNLSAQASTPSLDFQALPVSTGFAQAEAKDISTAPTQEAADVPAVPTTKPNIESATPIAKLTSPWDSSFPIPVSPEAAAKPVASFQQPSLETAGHQLPRTPSPSMYPTPQPNWQTTQQYPTALTPDSMYQQPYAQQQPQYQYPPPMPQQPYYAQQPYPSAPVNMPMYSAPHRQIPPYPSYQQQPVPQNPYTYSPGPQPVQTPPIPQQNFQPQRAPPPLPAKRPLSRVITNPELYAQTLSETPAASAGRPLSPRMDSKFDESSVQRSVTLEDKPMYERPLSTERIPFTGQSAHSPPRPSSNDYEASWSDPIQQQQQQQVLPRARSPLPESSYMHAPSLQRRSTSPMPRAQTIPANLPPPPPLPQVARVHTASSISSALPDKLHRHRPSRRDDRRQYSRDPEVINRPKFAEPSPLLSVRRNYDGPIGSSTEGQRQACIGRVVRVSSDHRFKRLDAKDVLSLRQGDQIMVEKTFAGTWWLGRNLADNRVGWVAIPYLDLTHPEADEEEQVFDRPPSVQSSHSNHSDPRRSQGSLSHRDTFDPPPTVVEKPVQQSGVVSSTYNAISAAANYAAATPQVSDFLANARSRREKRLAGSLAARLATGAIAAGASAASSYMEKPKEPKEPKVEEKEKESSRDIRRAERRARRKEEDAPALLTHADPPAAPRTPPTFETTPLVNGNRVVDIQLPKRLNYLARGDTGRIPPADLSLIDEREFTHVRCSEVTCAPLSLAEEGFALRPQLYAAPRETKLLVVLEVGKHDEPDTFVKKLISVYDAIEYLCTPGVDKMVEEWSPGSWKNIVLFIFDKGYWKSQQITQTFKDMGLLRDWTSGEEDLESDPQVADHVVDHPSEVEGKEVRVRLFEHTSIAKPPTTKGAFVGTRSTIFPLQTIVHSRIGELPDVHMKDLRRNDALPWINGLSSLLHPSLCIYLQSATAELPKNSLVRTWKEFETRKVTGKPTSNFPNTAAPTIDFQAFQAGFWKKMWGGGGGLEWHEVQPIAGSEVVGKFQGLVAKVREASVTPTPDAQSLSSTLPAPVANSSSPRSSAVELPNTIAVGQQPAVAPTYQQEHKAAWDAIVAAELPAQSVSKMPSPPAQAQGPRPFLVKAVFAYQPAPPNGPEDVGGHVDLPFNEGQFITVLDEPNHEWFRGRYTDIASGQPREGLFPQNFVARLT